MKIVRYFFVGGAAAALDFAIFGTFAYWLEFNYLVVGCFGFILATLLNYMLSVKHVFVSGVRFSKRKEILLVYGVSLVGLSIHQLMLYTCVSKIQLGLMTSKVIATGAVFAWNFAARNYYVFRERP